LGEDVSSPYAYTWTNVAAGNYTISAKAYDNTGAVTTAGSVAVKVVTVTTDQCAGLAAYVENGGYVPASKVKNAGKRYECKEFPYSGWCNGAAWAYAPGTGAYWTDAWYERGSCTARTSEEESMNVVLAPNPTTGILNVQVEKPSTVSIYNSLGTEVMSAVVVDVNGTLDLSSFSAGIYLVKIDSGSNVTTQTILKR